MKECPLCGATVNEGDFRCWYCNADLTKDYNTYSSKRPDNNQLGERDPKGYYSILGIKLDASAAEIKRAFRQKAKEFHPDRNKTEDAKKIFQKISEAYSVLKDPIRRADYDASGLFTQAAEEEFEYETSIPEPITCSACGKITAQPRYVIFWEVQSYLFLTRRIPVQGIFCRRCADKRGLRATLVTWLLGWWGIPWGPLYSIHAIFRNLFGGIKPRDINARLLAAQASFFALVGSVDIARSVATEAIKLSEDQVLSTALIGFLNSLEDGQPILRLKNQWALRKSYSFFIQAAVITLVAVVGLFAFYNEPQQTKSASVYEHPRTPTVQKPNSFPTRDIQRKSTFRHVNVSAVNLRSGPGTQWEVLRILKRFETIEATGPTVNQIWLPVQTKDGLRGYVSSKYVGLGKGLLARIALCKENCGPRPKNGKVLFQENFGPHKLRVDNGTADDAIVKLRDISGSTILCFYVHGGQKAEISNIPEGNYHIQFACGKSYSDKCGLFAEDMTASAFPDLHSFHTEYKGDWIYTSVLEFTLHRVMHGNVQTSAIDLEKFLSD